MTETLIVQKVAYILASLCAGEWLSYLISVPRNISCKLEKNGKNSENFFHYFICKKNPERKNFDITFNLKRSLYKAR